jgi:hypothetical protein
MPRITFLLTPAAGLWPAHWEAKMPDGSFTPNPEPETVSTENTAATPRAPRDVSTISFPYADLKIAIETARAIFKAGTRGLSRDQLAGVMGQRAGSGNFSVKVGAARMFGLAETVADKYQLTRLGFDILASDEERVKTAMVRAFLQVPLYKRTYDEFRNAQLPPRPLGLESAFASFGVTPKQTDKARRAFENSARLAGFFDHGDDKLVEPILAAAPKETHQPQTEGAAAPQPMPPRDQKASRMEAQHPSIEGLLMSLPEPGEAWDTDGRVKWLRAAVAAFDLIYKSAGPEIMVTQVDPVKLAWSGFVQLLAKSDPGSVTPQMLLSTLIGSWPRPATEAPDNE